MQEKTTVNPELTYVAAEGKKLLGERRKAQPGHQPWNPKCETCPEPNPMYVRGSFRDDTAIKLCEICVVFWDREHRRKVELPHRWEDWR